MTSASTPPDNAPHWARPLYERQIVIAGELAEDGLELARAIKDKALAPDTVEPAALEGLALAYGRVSRATRLSLMLQARLIADLTAFDRKQAFDARWERRSRVENIVGRIVARAQDGDGASDDDGEEAERLAYETSERLDAEDLYGPLLSRPVSELVAAVCADLGVEADWPVLAAEAWALEEAESGAVGWPLAGAERSPRTEVQILQQSASP